MRTLALVIAAAVIGLVALAKPSRSENVGYYRVGYNLDGTLRCREGLCGPAGGMKPCCEAIDPET
jgi:hypothetical protein